MADPTDPTQVPYVDLPDLAERYVDQVRLTHFDGQTVRVEFAVSRPHVVQANRSESALYPVARLVMSPFCALALQEQLSQLLRVMEQSGVIKRVSPSPTAKQ
ncbi:MAG TPA: hypothetical protein VF848_12255 [Steroidobacteraceae bacterium]